jgi:hypothetical protein
MSTRLEKLVWWDAWFTKIPRVVSRPVLAFLYILIRRFVWTEAQRVEHALDQLSRKHPRLIEIAERIKMKQARARARPKGTVEWWDDQGISFLIDKYERMRSELLTALTARRDVVDPDYVPAPPKMTPGPFTAEELQKAPQRLPDPPGYRIEDFLPAAPASMDRIPGKQHYQPKVGQSLPNTNPGRTKS